jgi:hypothetical protein
MSPIFKWKGEFKHGKHATIQFRSYKNPEERILHREGPPLCRLPHPAIGDQTAAVDIRPAPRLAQDMVAGLEGQPSEGMRLHSRGGYRSLRTQVIDRTWWANIEIRMRRNEKGGKEMLNNDWRLERIWSGLGWGAFFILVGGLIFAANKSWITGGDGWLYLAIGTGIIMIIEFLVHYFANRDNRWKASGSLIVGLSLVYVGAAFRFGFGDWWPLVFVLVGFGYITKGVWQHSNRLNAP